MTERLYYRDAYLTAFEANLVESADAGRRVYLDRTAFYPTSGGQPFDTGTLGGLRVLDVLDEGERIAHVLEAPLGQGPLQGHVDWSRRFDHMQQHTGQHLLSGVFHELFGWETVSVHFGAERSTLDLETAEFTASEATLAEERANQIVTEDRPVTIGFEDAASITGLRKESKRAGELRIVTIEGVDRSACGGTHVRRTGEIGPILVRKLDKVRKQVRVEFLCGSRAVRQARADFDLLTRLGSMFSAATDDLPAAVETLRAELKAANTATRTLQEEVSGYRARELYERTEPDSAGVRWAVEQRDARGVDELKALAQAYCGLPRTVLVGASLAERVILIATSADAGIDAAARLRAALAAAGGKGGGSARFAQGNVTDPARVMFAVQHLLAADAARP